MRKLKCSKLAQEIFDAIEEEGGSVYLVGGVVRDYMMKRTNKDYDIEVFHMSYAHLVEVLSCFGQVMTFGSSFAIIHLDQLPGYEFALPRVEYKTGTKHQDFSIEIDPELP